MSSYQVSQKIKVFLLIFGITLSSISLVSLWLINSPPTQPCPNLTDKLANPHEYLIIPATRLYIAPWAGQHRVYGLFLVPNKYKFNSRYFSFLTVVDPNEINPVDETSTLIKYEDLTAPEGYYISRNYLTTRQSLGYILTGKSGDLHQTCQWQMHLVRYK